ncbi:MAG: GNAT family N-acetyltransferase [Vicinamibacterales bacterium]
MRLEDWREWPAERLVPVFARQIDRWRDELGWEAHDLFELIEQARQGGVLPGLVAVDEDGVILGWCYASIQGGFLFVGALHGDRADIVRSLLDAVLDSPEASLARGYRCFVFPETPAVAAALARKRFDIQQFLYLQRPVAQRELIWPEALSVRAWTEQDLPDTARLLARAYAGSCDGHCFAPGGRLEEWAGYLAQIVRTPACGTWASGESGLVRAEGVTDPVAVLLATHLSKSTTHVAQIAVDPRWRGRGIGARLIEHAADQAVAVGATRQTLLVSQANATARAAYARLGFVASSHFLYAERSRISRVASSQAAETALEVTR